jgi:phospholipid:diacylglycerol acyltransferase
VHDHIHAIITIGTPFLGVPKSLTSLISGEMRDTAELSPPLAFLKNRLLSVREIAKLFRSWGSISHMLPKGGDYIWGNHEGASDDIVGSPSFGSMIKFKGSKASLPFDSGGELNDSIGLEPFLSNSAIAKLQYRNFTVSECFDLLRFLAPRLMKRVDATYSFGFAKNEANLSSSEYANSRFWSNPLESSLPDAPNLKIYNLYGSGKPAERAYFYQFARSCDGLSSPKSEFPMCIDSSFSSESEFISNGVQEVDGDGTVPLLSLSYMCRHGWKSGGLLNPYGVSVHCREYVHIGPRGMFEHGEQMLREHGGSGDHVDIMGNRDVLQDVVRMAISGDI